MAPVQTTQIALDCMVAVALRTLLGLVVLVDSATAPAVSLPPVAQQPDAAPDPEPTDDPPIIAMPEQLLPAPDPTLRISVQYDDSMRFGITTTSGNPEDPTDDFKQLTFSPTGGTNNARLWVDGSTPNMGSGDGRLPHFPVAAGDGSSSDIWGYGDVHVTQAIQIIPGQPSRRMDTAQVDYVVENRGGSGHDVGFRIMLDSLIGSNDGVPFIVPGRQELVTEPIVFGA